MTSRTTSSSSIILAVSLITVVAVPTVVYAQDSKVGIAACVDDVRSFCALSTADTVQACIKTRFREFSLPCQIAAVKYATFRRTCHQEVKKHCAGIAPGEGRVEVCIRDHFAELGKDCTKTILQATGKVVDGRRGSASGPSLPLVRCSCMSAHRGRPEVCIQRQIDANDPEQTWLYFFGQAVVRLQGVSYKAADGGSRTHRNRAPEGNSQHRS